MTYKYDLTQDVAYKIFGISWHQFEWRLESRYVLQAPSVKMNTGMCYRQRLCRWKSVCATGPGSVSEHQYVLVTESVDEYQHLLQA